MEKTLNQVKKTVNKGGQVIMLSPVNSNSTQFTTPTNIRTETPDKIKLMEPIKLNNGDLDRVKEIMKFQADAYNPSFSFNEILEKLITSLSELQQVSQLNSFIDYLN